MVRKINSLLVIIIAISCDSPKSILLGDNITKVPLDNIIFNHKQQLSKVSKDIDTLVLYEKFTKYGYVPSNEGLPKKIKINLPERLNFKNPRGVYETYRFYENGCVNFFILVKGDSLTKEELNPQFSGYKGIIFKLNDEIAIDSYVQAGEMGNHGISRKFVKILGDTLIITGKGETYSEYFIKRKIPKEWLIYKADW
jgi:hypothetical protein